MLSFILTFSTNECQSKSLEKMNMLLSAILKSQLQVGYAKIMSLIIIS